MHDGSRKVVEICEIAGVQEGEIILNPLFQFSETGEAEGKISGELRATGNRLRHSGKLDMAGVKLDEEGSG